MYIPSWSKEAVSIQLLQANKPSPPSHHSEPSFQFVFITEHCEQSDSFCKSRISWSPDFTAYLRRVYWQEAGLPQPVHYWLSGSLRWTFPLILNISDRFTSHFIHIQIFQVNFSLILNLTKWKLINPISYGKGTSWTLLNETNSGYWSPPL